MDLIQQEVSGLQVVVVLVAITLEAILLAAREVQVLRLELLMLVQAMVPLHREMDLLQEKTLDPVAAAVAEKQEHQYRFVEETVVLVSSSSHTHHKTSKTLLKPSQTPPQGPTRHRIISR
jgi:hypothetical protein